MAQAQTVSINKIRADAVLVTRGFFMLYWVPAFVLVMLILPLFREPLGAAPLRSPVIWILVALTPAGLFVANFGIARMTAPYLWVLIGSLTLLAIGGAALVVALGTIVAQEASAVAWFFVVPWAIMFAAGIYWVLISPTVAALRLQAIRVPPDDTPLPKVLASPLPQRDSNVAVPLSKNRKPVVIAYRVFAAAVGVAATMLVLRLMAAGDRVNPILLASVVAIAAFWVITMLLRRARMHAAVSADAALLADSRRPILYLRSFKDDPYKIDPEWDMVVRTPWSRGGRRREQGLIARLIASMPTGLNSMSGGRLEERLDAVVAPIGPFITVGAPDEPLQKLGAARVYLATDSWQSKVIDLMDRAQLIVTAAGPTRSVQWELDTVLSRNAWSKLVVLMPPSTQEDHAARWGAIVAELQNESWHDALAGLDPREVIAMRLLDGGGISAVTSDRRLTVDYVLAMRIMLHQMQQAVAT